MRARTPALSRRARNFRMVAVESFSPFRRGSDPTSSSRSSSSSRVVERRSYPPPMSRLVDPPAWEAFDADSDGSLGPEEELAFNDALEAWYGEGEKEPDWMKIKFWYDYQWGEALSHHAEGSRAFASKQRPLLQRMRIRTTSAFARSSKVVGYTIAALLFAAACGIILSILFGGPGCLTPWSSCW